MLAILDSGIDDFHPEFQGRLLPGKTFVSCGADGCGDGTLQGGHSHGTHVAGIAAATKGNGIGIAGVAPETKLMSVKVLNSNNSGTFLDWAYGVRWATDRGADVINMSLISRPGNQALYEFDSLFSQSNPLSEAIEYASNKGVLVVISAGNESAPLCDRPAWDKGALCVASTDRRGAKSWFSNLALKKDLLAVSAPGGGLPICGDGPAGEVNEGVISTYPIGRTNCELPDSYGVSYGTSMAAPHVSGVAALLYSMSCSRAQTLEILLKTSITPGTSYRGMYTPSYGYGLVDAAAAVEAGKSCKRARGSTNQVGADPLAAPSRNLPASTRSGDTSSSDMDQTGVSQLPDLLVDSTPLSIESDVFEQFTTEDRANSGNMNQKEGKASLVIATLLILMTTTGLTLRHAQQN